MIGEDGGIQCSALLSYNFALSLLIVTNNVVVLCEYLPQEFPLWGTIKGYCVVLYCMSSNEIRRGNMYTHQLGTVQYSSCTNKVRKKYFKHNIHG